MYMWISTNFAIWSGCHQMAHPTLAWEMCPTKGKRKTDLTKKYIAAVRERAAGLNFKALPSF
jgi:hypothetical protein